MMENDGLVSKTTTKHIKGRHLGLEPARSSRGRILPSSTADVQAAINAIQARSAALRRQQQNAVSAEHQHEKRTDGVGERSSCNRRESISGSTIDSEDMNEDCFANIGNVIDQVNGMKNDEEDEEDSISGSDSDESSDLSLGEDGNDVSKATKVNIGAFIDSLNAAAKMPVADNQHEGDDVDTDNDGHVQMDTASEDGKKTLADNSVNNVEMAESKVPVQYDELKLDEYIDKAINVVRKSRATGSDPNFDRLEDVVFYAWKNKVPIIPVIDAFDDAMKGRKECSATRFTYLIREAVKIIEEEKFDYIKSIELLKVTQAKSIDISFLKAMFKNPEKHIPYQDEDEMIAHIENLNLIGAGLEKKNDSRVINRRNRQRAPIQKVNSSDDSKSKVNSSDDSKSAADGANMRGARSKRVYFGQKMQQLTNAHSHYLRGIETPEGIPGVSGVNASKMILSKKIFQRHPTITPFRVGHWKLSKAERKEGHSGYHGVHARSLSKLAAQAGIHHTSESFNWEKLELELTKKRRLVDTVNWVGKCA